jgi:hypothetical protein
MVKEISVTTDVNGNALLNVVFPMTIFSTSNYITATATDSSGNTSGFSNCIQVKDAETPTPTPTPAAWQYNPFFTPEELVFGTCGPEKIQIGVDVLNPPEDLAYLQLFVKLMDKKTGENGEWSAGMVMKETAPNRYVFDVTLEKIPGYDNFPDAWLKYQFVAYNKAEEKIGYSDVYADIPYQICANFFAAPSNR